nr:MlaD family protein [uncultured Rhodopila sp.]
MSGAGPKTLGQSTVRKSRRLPVIWAVPLVAILIGLWLAWDTLSKEGPNIVVSFQDAEGLQAGQSQLKYKEITLGTVKSFDFTKDRRGVLVTIATTAQAEQFLTAGTQFWVVKPRLFAGNISGASTLLSGSYVGLLPGDPSAKAERNFVGREDPPVIDSDVPGTTFFLKSEQLGSVSLGSPVFYRGLSVGEVLGWDIGKMAESVTIHAFVRAPYDSYVRDQTRFWNASGLSVKLGGGGVEVQVESLRALLLGGIAFETAAKGESSPISAPEHVFPLFANQDSAKNASYSRKIPLLAYFSSSVRGLAPGSDVVMHGLTVGKVTDVRLSFDVANDTVQAPVHFEVEPERVLGVGNQAFKNTAEGVQLLVSKGMRASLQSGNLLTGEMLISLEVVPDAPNVKVTEEEGSFLIPVTETAGLAGLQASAGELLRNVNAIPFASIGQSVATITKNFSSLSSGPQLQQTLNAVAATMTSAESAIKKLDTEMGPTLKQLPGVATELQTSLKQMDLLMRSVNTGYGDNTQFHRDLDRLMAQLNDAVRSFQALADLLTRHPEALVRGRTDSGAQ